MDGNHCEVFLSSSVFNAVLSEYWFWALRTEISPDSCNRCRWWNLQSLPLFAPSHVTHLLPINLISCSLPPAGAFSFLPFVAFLLRHIAAIKYRMALIFFLLKMVIRFINHYILSLLYTASQLFCVVKPHYVINIHIQKRRLQILFFPVNVH